MRLIIKLVIVIIGFAFVPTDGDDLLELLNETAKSSYSFKCGEPQRKAVRISTLVEVGPHDIVYPSHVILDRCDDMTGTCKNTNEHCASVGPTTKVKFAYFVTNPSLDTRKLLASEAESHTQCGCMAATENPIK